MNTVNPIKRDAEVRLRLNKTLCQQTQGIIELTKNRKMDRDRLTKIILGFIR